MKTETFYPEEVKLMALEDHWIEKGKETYIFPVGAHTAYEIQILLYHKHSDKMEAAASLYLIGDWFDTKTKEEFFEREFLFTGSMRECMVKAKEDYMKKNMKRK